GARAPPGPNRRPPRAPPPAGGGRRPLLCRPAVPQIQSHPDEREARPPPALPWRGLACRLRLCARAIPGRFSAGPSRAVAGVVVSSSGLAHPPGLERLGHRSGIEGLGEEEVDLKRAGIARREEELPPRRSVPRRLVVRLAQSHALGGGRLDRPGEPRSFREP